MNEWIKEYQCPGCIKDDNDCFIQGEIGISCITHHPATYVSNVGKIFLGLPKGFNRIGTVTDMNINIFHTDKPDKQYNIFNIPVWKYINEAGHTIVRGIMPRINTPFIHIYLYDCVKEINCIEITQEMLKSID